MVGYGTKSWPLRNLPKSMDINHGYYGTKSYMGLNHGTLNKGYTAKKIGPRLEQIKLVLLRRLVQT